MTRQSIRAALAEQAGRAAWGRANWLAQLCLDNQRVGAQLQVICEDGRDPDEVLLELAAVGSV